MCVCMDVSCIYIYICTTPCIMYTYNPYSKIQKGDVFTLVPSLLSGCFDGLRKFYGYLYVNLRGFHQFQ